MRTWNVPVVKCGLDVFDVCRKREAAHEMIRLGHQMVTNGERALDSLRGEYEPDGSTFIVDFLADYARRMTEIDDSVTIASLRRYK